MAAPVQQHPAAGRAEQGQPGEHPHGGAAGEELAVVKAEDLGPQGLGRVERLPRLVQVPRPRDLGHVQGGQGDQLRQGQPAALVAGHVEPGRLFCGIVFQRIIKGGGHEKTS